jgi:dimethylargininase
MRKAIVRPPGESFLLAISEQVPRPRIDVGLARLQHAEYCAALRTAGLDLIVLPPDEEHPDACFVQDTAVIYNDLAVLGRFGVESRQGEQEGIRLALQERKRVVDLRTPATLEGGDVLRVGSRFFVGLSVRTNRAGYAQLRELLELEGAAVEALPVPTGLHLLSGCCYLGNSVLLATEVNAALPSLAGLDIITVSAEEASAANALAIGSLVILPAGNPLTEAQIQARGFRVLPVSLTEFAKADGGVTCLALLL